ncbi:unnamed protein product [Darwinula stevensoni]|uniref:Glycosyltransferase family 92 protein n=1 Tax=Darwinula stevensoni TaxID=69355 RepID=A0A7R8XLC5_9CRUS|nr:unnamed protein product [Darwinula stevensoni]CAG0894083.1 unnamed protein product [Darwinula stevensoni]
MFLGQEHTAERHHPQRIDGRGKNSQLPKHLSFDEIPWKKFRNVPLDYLPLCNMGSKAPGIYPCLDNLQFNNLYYQHLRLRKQDTDIYLYSAFHDHRNESKIRIFGMIIGPEKSVPTLKCKFYEGNQTYGFREGQFKVFYHEIQLGWPVPFTLKCALKEGEPIPDAVSVLPSEADEPVNILKVFQRDEKTLSNESHAVSLCVRQLYFVQDLSYLLTEWLEILKSMEVGKVFAYGLQTHPNMERVLEFYEDQFKVFFHEIQLGWPVPFTLKCGLKEGEPIPNAVSVLPSEADEPVNILKVFQRDEKTMSNESHAVSCGGFVDYIPITFPGTQPNIPGPNGPFLPRNENFHRGFYHLQLNDCLYRSLVQGYEYVSVMDVDEMIAPNPENRSWPRLMQSLVPKNPDWDCYYFQTRIILMEEGETTGWKQDYTIKLRQTKAAEFPKESSRVGKSICTTEKQEIMSNHFSEICYPGDRPCAMFVAPTDFGELYHYGKCWVGNCTGSGGNATCDGQSCDVVQKSSLLAHKDSVRQGVFDTLLRLNLLP